MALNLTPNATPLGGFPLVLTTPTHTGEVAQVIFPSNAVKDIERHNQCPNPRFLNNTNSWSVSGAQLSQGRVATIGSAATNTGLPSEDIKTATQLTMTSGGIAAQITCSSLAVVTGLDYVVSMYVYLQSLAAGQSLQLRVRNSTQSVVGTVAQLTAPAGGWVDAKQWLRLSVPVTATETATWDCQVRFTDGPGVAYATACLFEQASVLKSYFDGEFDGYSSWDGAQGNSASTHAEARNAARFRAMQVLQANGAYGAAAT